MKRWLIILLMACGNMLSAQTTTLVFQPDANCGRDALLTTRSPDINYATHHDILIAAWTYGGGIPMTIRAVLAFDLSAIPPGTTVIGATLDLFHHTSINNNPGHSTLSGPNDASIYRVTQSWSESTVTWNTQPSYTTLNSVFMPASTSSTQNYSMNVTAMVQDMINDPAHSFGFLIKENNESYYRDLLFASSDDNDPALRPRLTIVLAAALPINDPCYTTTVVPDTTTGPVVPPDTTSNPSPVDTTASVTGNPVTDPLVLVIPNIFTPDQDNINDIYFITVKGFVDYEMEIYDRWGILVKKLQPAQVAWDGKTKQGDPCPDGTYYYLLKLTTNAGEHREEHGYILLTRNN